MSGPRIRVLVVDDSAFARKVVREVLTTDPEIEVVDVARDGIDALEKINDLDPDVVTLDLLMPNLDGVGVLQALGRRSRPQCVVVSTAEEHGSLAIKALQAGAVDVVHKPTALATDRLYELSTDLVRKVKIAAQARRGSLLPPLPRISVPPADRRVTDLIVVGASTGGPQALTRLLAELPADFPVPIAIALHMPVGYTAALAERLNDLSALDVVEASDGLRIRPGTVVIGRAGIHLGVMKEAGAARVRLDVVPLDTPHRPSVDVLFSTAATHFGGGVLGVVLTGMGEDGLQGSRVVRRYGGRILSEHESSCVVYGMPRAVVEAGLSNEQAPLETMAEAIVRSL